MFNHRQFKLATHLNLPTSTGPGTWLLNRKHVPGTGPVPNPQTRAPDGSQGSICGSGSRVPGLPVRVLCAGFPCPTFVDRRVIGLGRLAVWCRRRGARGGGRRCNDKTAYGRQP